MPEAINLCDHYVTQLERSCLCEFNGDNDDCTGEAVLLVENREWRLGAPFPEGWYCHMCRNCFAEHLRLHREERGLPY